MVRGIYQTSEASKDQVRWVSWAVALAVILIGVAGLCSLAINLGDQVCDMRHYTSHDGTYTFRHHAEQELGRKGYTWASFKDMGNVPPGRSEANPRLRRFLVKSLKTPDGEFYEQAWVDVVFDSFNQCFSLTYLKTITAIE
jgi:hypothetical protein